MIFILMRSLKKFQSTVVEDSGAHEEIQDVRWNVTIINKEIIIMKKISLKNVKETLSRKEMKTITAGSYSSDPLCDACLRHFYQWYCSMVYYGC